MVTETETVTVTEMMIKSLTHTKTVTDAVKFTWLETETEFVIET